jgi:hypothetical protein
VNTGFGKPGGGGATNQDHRAAHHESKNVWVNGTADGAARGEVVREREREREMGGIGSMRKGEPRRRGYEGRRRLRGRGIKGEEMIVADLVLGNFKGVRSVEQ